VSAVTDRLTEDDVRWLARMNRVLRARRAEAARAEALRGEREQEHGDESPHDDGPRERGAPRPLDG
jgi:hypothetical protein